MNKYIITGLGVFILSLFAAIGFMQWQLSNAEEKNIALSEANAVLEQSNAQLAQDLQSSEDQIAALKDQIEFNDAITTRVQAEKDRYAKANQNLKKTITELKREKPEIKIYLDGVKPGPIVRMLTDLQKTGNNENGSDSSITPDGANATHGKADSAMLHKSVWRSAHNRLQHGFRSMQRRQSSFTRMAC